jgi:hypothetical protein
MNRRTLGPAGQLLLLAGAAAVIALAGLAGGGAWRGALVVTLVFWTALAQGSVAVVAVTDLTGAKWAGSLRRELLVAAQLLPVLALLFLAVWPALALYPWDAAPGGWLNRPFFMARNLALLLATAATARHFARRSLRRDPGLKGAAVAYLLLFVASQTLVAFDWVMSLSYPWVSSMFGMYFMVEAVFAGLALAGLLALLLDRRRREDASPGWAAALGDLGRLLFGFSVLWGGLFFAQFLLLWYGNIPEEVGFIATRLARQPTRALATLFPAACFGVPFLALLTARAKRDARVLGAASLSILVGLLAEKLLFVMPALAIAPVVLAVEILLLGAAWLISAGWGKLGEP